MTMSASEAAAKSGQPVLELGRGWMMAPATAQRAEELGLAQAGRFGFWVNGRAGVLGDVDHRVAASAIGFMAPAAVQGYWLARPADLTADQAALAWFDAAATWTRSLLEPMSEADVRRLADLARRVVDGADLSVGALFAGSSLIPLPGDAAGDAGITLNVLRELRGGAHLASSHAGGLGPHRTIMSTDDPIRGGASWAEGFGWSAPHPAPDASGRAQVELVTNAIMARPFEALSPGERSEFVELVGQARACMPD